MILVFDSGVWISARHFGGTPRYALNLFFQRARIAMCDPIEFEIRRALREKFRWTDIAVDQALESFRSSSVQIAIAGTIGGICRDPNDDMVLECAVAADASMIVTGDKDLLTLSKFDEIRIVTPRTFLNEFAP